MTCFDTKGKNIPRTLMRKQTYLQENGILKREGGRKDGRWVILVPND